MMTWVYCALWLRAGVTLYGELSTAKAQCCALSEV